MDDPRVTAESEDASNAAESEDASNAAESQDEEDDEGARPKTSRGWVARRSEQVKLLRALIIDLVVSLVLFGCIAVLVQEFSSHAIILDEIEVPKDVSTKGLTATSVSKRLADQILEFQIRSAEGSSARRLLQPAWVQDDIQVPGGNVSIRSVIRFFKDEFALPDLHIGGEITEHFDNRYVLIIRNSEMGAFFISDPFKLTDFDATVKKAGQEIVRITNPYVLASYFYSTEVKKNSFPNTLHWIKYSLAKNVHSSRAYNLWGNVLDNQGQIHQAIEKYKLSIATRDHFPEAYSNLGDAYVTIGMSEEAIDSYQQAIWLNSDLPSAHVGLGNTFWNLGRYNEAIEHFQAAIAADPTLVWPRVNLGDVYSEIGERPKAQAEYTEVAHRAETMTLALDSEQNLAGAEVDIADVYAAWGTELLRVEKPLRGFAAVQESRSD